MLEKKTLNILTNVAVTKNKLNVTNYKYIKKGDKVAINIQTGKNKTQTIEGICTKIKKEQNNPAITVKYKLSGVIIEQRIPLGLQELNKIYKL